jgi:DNA (cytosine-5)-methyltransferase 1
MQEIVHIDLFAGIGGFAKGLQDAGLNITHHYFSEIDKHAIAVYKHRFPHAKLIGSVINVSGRQIREQHPQATIIVTFGWPCQDNSIAGKRRGQRKGTRSGLLFEAGRIISESSAQHFIAENVKGLSSVNKGYDYYDTLGFLTYLDTDSPQHTVEVQLFNTSWFLPQNRERFYFVGHFGTGGVRRILPVGEDMQEIVRLRRSNASTLTTRYYQSQANGDYIIASDEKVRIRRLTEVECEKLQGFPANWTEYGNYDGVIKKTPKAQRYKQIGNAVTVKIPETIARKLFFNQ